MNKRNLDQRRTVSSGVRGMERAGAVLALDYLLANTETSEVLRARLSDQVQRHFAKVVSRAQKNEIASQLSAVVADIKMQVQFGEESPVFRRYNRILQDAMKRFSLVREGEAEEDNGGHAARPPDTTALPPLPNPGLKQNAVKQFSEYAAIIVARVKGVLTDRVRQMLKTRQNELGLSDDRADAIVRAETGKFAPLSESEAQTAYRRLLRDLLELGGGKLDEDAELDLADFEAKRGISPSEAARIRTEMVGPSA